MDTHAGQPFVRARPALPFARLGKLCRGLFLLPDVPCCAAAASGREKRDGWVHHGGVAAGGWADGRAVWLCSCRAHSLYWCTLRRDRRTHDTRAFVAVVARTFITVILLLRCARLRLRLHVHARGTYHIMFYVSPTSSPHMSLIAPPCMHALNSFSSSSLTPLSFLFLFFCRMCLSIRAAARQRSLCINVLVSVFHTYVPQSTTEMRNQCTVLSAGNL